MRRSWRLRRSGRRRLRRGGQSASFDRRIVRLWRGHDGRISLGRGGWVVRVRCCWEGCSTWLDSIYCTMDGGVAKVSYYDTQCLMILDINRIYILVTGVACPTHHHCCDELAFTVDVVPLAFLKQANSPFVLSFSFLRTTFISSSSGWRCACASCVVRRSNSP